MDDTITKIKMAARPPLRLIWDWETGIRIKIHFNSNHLLENDTPIGKQARNGIINTSPFLFFSAARSAAAKNRARCAENERESMARNKNGPSIKTESITKNGPLPFRLRTMRIIGMKMKVKMAHGRRGIPPPESSSAIFIIVSSM